MTPNYFFILFLTFFIFLTPAAISSPINVCNYSYIYEGSPPLLSYYLQSVNYATLGSNGNYYCKCKVLQAVIFAASSQPSQAPSLLIFDFYTRTFKCAVSQSAFGFVNLPNNTIVFLGNNKQQLYTIGYNCNVNPLGIRFPNSIVAYLWVDALGRFFVIDNTTKDIYDHKGIKESFRLSDINMLSSYNEASFSNMTFDPIHGDLYIVLGNDILVYNPTQKQFWYKFTAHVFPLWDIRVISSPIPEKFCIISMHYNPASTIFTLFRWQPDRSQFYANLTSIYVDNSTTDFLYSSFYHGGPPASITLIYRNEFLVLSFYFDQTYHVIEILNTDFSYGNYFYYPNSGPSNPAPVHVSGGVENTDIFFVHYCNIMTTQVTQYSLFSDFPSCARCQKGLNLWFYSYMRGCSNTCDNFTLKNFPFCETKYSSQTCILQDSTNQLCGGCDNNNGYIQISRFNISLECSPIFACSSTNPAQYEVSIGICPNCDPSCLTCVGGQPSQCLSCVGNYYYNPSTSTCSSS